MGDTLTTAARLRPVLGNRALVSLAEVSLFLTSAIRVLGRVALDDNPSPDPLEQVWASLVLPFRAFPTLTLVELFGGNCEEDFSESSSRRTAC